MGCLALKTALVLSVILQVLNADTSSTVQSSTAPPVTTGSSLTATQTSTATTIESSPAPPGTTSTSSIETQTSTATTANTTTPYSITTSTSPTEPHTSAAKIDTTTTPPVTTRASSTESQASTAITPPATTSTSLSPVTTSESPSSTTTTSESSTAPPITTSTSSTETITPTATTVKSSTSPPITTSTSSTETITPTATTVKSNTTPPVTTSAPSTETITSTATTSEKSTVPPVTTSASKNGTTTSTAITAESTAAPPVTTSVSSSPATTVESTSTSSTETQTSTAATVESSTAATTSTSLSPVTTSESPSSTATTPPIITKTNSTETTTSTATTAESSTAPPGTTGLFSSETTTSTATTVESSTAPPVTSSTYLTQSQTSTATAVDTTTAPSVPTSTSLTKTQTLTATSAESSTTPLVPTSAPSTETQTLTATSAEGSAAPPVTISSSSTESQTLIATSAEGSAAPPVPTSASSTETQTLTATSVGTTTAISVTTGASSTATQATTATKPGVINNLKASEKTTSVFLEWDKPLNDGLSFNVQWIGDKTGNISTKDTSYNVTGLTAGVQYTFTIKAVSKDNLTEGDAFYASVCTKPDVIRNLTSSNITTSSAFLKWDEPVGQRSFFQINKTKKDRSNGLTVFNTYFVFTDLRPGVTYTLCIRAVATDNKTEGEFSCISVTTVFILDNDTGDKTGIVVGTIMGFLCLIIIVILILFIYKRRRTQLSESPLDIPIHNIRDKISTALKIEDFEEYYTRKHADSNCGFAEQYEEIKLVGIAQAKNSALAIENKAKNRYNDVLPYDASRVKLSMCGNPCDDYINANYIPGYNSKKEFIAAQGPLPITVNEFWRMIWEKNVYTLVMLTKCKEQGRVKCEKYWPSGTSYYHNISVTIIAEIALECWTIRDFSIKNVKTAETRNIRQFHFTAWPDHGVPQTTELLIDFRHVVREHIDQYSRHSPTIVHCSAGVGRTGTFIAIDRLIFQIERESMVDVYGVVHDMRMHRPFMVQTEAQYVYLQQCAYDIIRSRTGTNVDLIYQNTEAPHTYVNIPVKKAF